jgi:uncharacterized membrane protein
LLASAEEGNDVPPVVRKRQASELWAGVLIGLGLGGFFDGIVLHQILQWHHMLSSQGDYPVTTVAGLEVNTLWDGLFHALTYMAVVAGLVLMWRTQRLSPKPWSARLLIGLLLIGWGGFNLVEGTINHHLLTIHHVNETVARSEWKWWDIGFLVWGAVMLAGGWRLVQAGEMERGRLNHDAPDPTDQGWPSRRV